MFSEILSLKILDQKNIICKPSDICCKNTQCSIIGRLEIGSPVSYRLSAGAFNNLFTYVPPWDMHLGARYMEGDTILITHTRNCAGRFHSSLHPELALAFDNIVNKTGKPGPFPFSALPPPPPPPCGSPFPPGTRSVSSSICLTSK